MSETARLSLPLLMPSQAQKHVTVNEALLRLDALTQLVLRSRSLVAPPVNATEGDCYGVPVEATGGWLDSDGEIAIFVGGGWDFVTPARGWRAFVEDESAFVVYDGDWTPQGGAPAPAGGPAMRMIAMDHSVVAGPSSATPPAIPAGASVWGITGRVVDAIGGATSFRIGIAGAEDRYGSRIGTAVGSWLRGLTGSPLTYWEETPLVLYAEGGDFDGTGLIRLLVYAVELPLPE